MTKVWGATSTADEVLSGIDLHGKRILVTGVSAASALRRRGLLRPTARR